MSAVRIYTAAGHGGRDPGAVDGIDAGDDLYTEEEDVSLAFTLAQNAALRRCGFILATRRTTDTALPVKADELRARYEGARRHRADCASFNHANASTSDRARGIEVLYDADNVAARALAVSVYLAMAKVSPWPDRGARDDSRGLAVLRGTNAYGIEGIVIELDFLTNDAAERLLRDPAYLARLAEASVKGICSYYNVRYYAPPTDHDAPAKTPHVLVVTHSTRADARTDVLRATHRGDAVSSFDVAPLTGDAAQNQEAMRKAAVAAAQAAGIVPAE